MKKLSAFIFFFSATVLSVSAQKKLSYVPKPEEWPEKPVVHPVPHEYANEHAVILLNEQQIDLRHEDGAINRYYSVHRLVKVLDHYGIEEFNTVEIPHWYAMRIPLIKARTILPNGKVKDIAKDMILTTESETGNYKVVIAMEGIEKDAEIELLVQTIVPEPFFSSISFQYPVPVMRSTLEISYPKDISIQVKSRNGLPNAPEYIVGNRKHISIAVNNIPPLRDEPYSFYPHHAMSAELRVSDFASDLDKTKELSWDSLSRALHNYNYNITEKEKKAVNDFLTELGVAYYDSEWDKIKKIEAGIKQKITLYAAVDYDERKEIFATNNFRSLSTYDVGYSEKKAILDTIIAKKAATQSGYIKLFAACFAQAGVNHELGMTTDHEEYVLDPAFPNFDQMEYTLFYFPNQKKYLSPTDIYLRCPFIPEEATSTKGVFSTIPPYKMKGDISKDMLYDIRTIKPLSARETQSNVVANVSFTKDMDAQIDIAYSYTGYYAPQVRRKLALLKGKEQEDYINSLISVADKKEDVVKYTVSNEGFDKYYGNKPVELYASVTTSRLTGTAGPKYLFNVGAIIGHQVELYSEERRKMPVDLDYPHSASHQITVNIPKGYKISNPEVLKTNQDFLNSEMQPVMGFSTDYKIEDNKLVITASEYYSQLHFPISEYDRFRQVMNAASDFSKMKIVLEKGHMKTNSKTKPVKKHTKKPAKKNIIA